MQVVSDFGLGAVATEESLTHFPISFSPVADDFELQIPNMEIIEGDTAIIDISAITPSDINNSEHIRLSFIVSTVDSDLVNLDLYDAGEKLISTIIMKGLMMTLWEALSAAYATARKGMTRTGT